MRLSMNFSVYQQWRKRRVIGIWPSQMGYLGDADIVCCRGFKGLKQAIKLEYKLGRYEKVWLYFNVAAWSLTNSRQQNIIKCFLLT